MAEFPQRTIFITGEKGLQDLNTNWNSENNEIGYFDFNESIPIEIYFKYNFKTDDNLIPNIILTHNWMGTDNSNLILEWNFYLDKLN